MGCARAPLRRQWVRQEEVVQSVAEMLVQGSVGEEEEQWRDLGRAEGMKDRDKKKE